MDEEPIKPPDGYELILGTLHVDENGNAFCNQRGQLLQLCNLEEFKQAQGIHRCRRCSQLLGMEEHWREDVETLSKKQISLLVAIFRKTEGNDKDAWCFAAGLSEDKSSSGRSSLHRSLRRLQGRGFIEKKVNAHNRALVRLSNQRYPFVYYKIRKGIWPEQSRPKCKK